MSAISNARESAGSAVSLTGIVGASALLTGIYNGVCEGYKPQHETEYLREYPRLLQMRADAKSGLIVPELDKFDAYMKSLTEVKWQQEAPNLVTTVGANLALDTFLAGSAYTVTGPFMGLIGAVGYSAIVIADTMASHAGWTEGGTANAPTYTGPRKTIAWSAAAAKSKSPSAAPVFAITGSGTVKGVFLTYGSGAVSTIDSTAGVLYSAGLFTGGDQIVANTNTVTVTYAASL